MVSVWPANLTDPHTWNPTVYTMSTALTNARAGCLADRYILISGGIGKGCNRNVYMLDTQKLPAPKAALPLIGVLNATGSVAVAASLHGDTVGFYDGTTLDLFHL
jgi:hypothetical protein